MKSRHLILAALAAAIFATGCDNRIIEPADPNIGSEIICASYADSFTATIEEPVQTKTSLKKGDDVFNIVWSNGDEVTLLSENIIDGQAVYGTFTYSTTGDGEFSVKKGQGPDRQTAARWSAVYPASAGATMDGDAVSLTLPDTQVYADGTFGQGAYPMLATVTGPAAEGKTGEWEPSFYFKGLGGVIRLNITSSIEETVRSIEIETPGSAVSGAFVTGSGYSLAYAGESVADADTRLTLDCSKGVKVGSSSKTFMIVVPAGEYSGFSITIKGDIHSRKFSLKKSNTVKVSRARFTDINLDVNDWDYLYEVVETEKMTYSQAKSHSLEMADISPIFTLNGLFGFKASGYGKDDGSQYMAVVLNYPTADASGKIVWASGRIYYTCDTKGAAKAPSHIVLDSHYTIGSSSEAPSEFWTFDVGIALQKGLVVVPDYIGYGSTRNLDHPYLCYDLCARNELDMVRAAKTYMKDQGQTISNDISFYSIGYSQGGSTALGVQRYIENEELESEFNLKRTYCGGGVYKPELFMTSMIGSGNSWYPAGVPLMLLGVKSTYPSIVKSSIESFFTDAFNDAGIIDMVRSKDYTVEDICGAINLAVGGNGNHDVQTSLFLSAATMDINSTQNKQLKEALVLQDLTKGWKNNGGKPKAPVYFFHYEKDETVDISQFEAVKSEFGGLDNITTEKANYAVAAALSSQLANHRGYAGIYYARMISGAYMK